MVLWLYLGAVVAFRLSSVTSEALQHFRQLYKPHAETSVPMLAIVPVENIQHCCIH